MHALNSFLKMLLQPELWVLTCLLVAWLVFRWERHLVVARRLLLLAIVMFWGLGTRPISEALLRPLEFHHPSLATAQIPPHDVAVVFGAGIKWQPGSEAATLLSTGSLDHLMCGVTMVRAGRVQKLLLAGGVPDLRAGKLSEADLMRDWAINLGVPPSAVVIEGRSQSTAERAAEVRRLLPNTDRIALIDSAYHLPRATATFSKQGFVVTPVPCDYSTSATPWSLRDFLPTVTRLEHTHRAMHEYVGLAFYWARGRL